MVHSGSYLETRDAWDRVWKSKPQCSVSRITKSHPAAADNAIAWGSFIIRNMVPRQTRPCSRRSLTRFGLSIFFPLLERNFNLSCRPHERILVDQALNNVFDDVSHEFVWVSLSRRLAAKRNSLAFSPVNPVPALPGKLFGIEAGSVQSRPVEDSRRSTEGTGSLSRLAVRICVHLRKSVVQVRALSGSQRITSPRRRCGSAGWGYPIGWRS